jgi:hypothetical protein
METSDPYRDILDDARLLSRFAASRGLLTDELSKAVTRASSVLGTSQLQGTSDQREQVEEGLLLAISSSVRKLGLSNVEQIRKYYSTEYSLVSGLARGSVLLLMMLLIILVIPMTFVFDQTTGRVAEISELDELIRSYGLYNAGRMVRFYSQNAARPLSGPPSKGDLISKTDQNSTGVGLSAAERHADLSRLQSRVEFLIRPPRMMDGAQLIVNGLYRRLFDRDRWIVIMRYYTRLYVPNREVDFHITDVGSVVRQLQMAEDDCAFISSLLGNGILPMLYGALGASVFLSRRYLMSGSEVYLMANPIGEAVTRIGLGAVAGVAIRWFQIPQAAEQITSTPLAMAFLAGFSLDIVISVMQRLIAVFDFKPDGAQK